jgi:hypothetical protein
MNDQFVAADTYTTQPTQKTITHYFEGIRTHKPASKRPQTYALEPAATEIGAFRTSPT